MIPVRGCNSSRVNRGPTSGARRFFTLLVFVVAALALLGRAVQLQHYRQDTLQGEADARQLRSAGISAHRGMITDRDGEPLAISTPVYAAWADPAVFDFSASAVSRLASSLGLEAAALRARLEDRKEKRFVYVKRQLEPGVAEQVRALELAGVSLLREYRRFYPMSEAAAHLVGATNLDDAGIEGIEKQFERTLKGIPGRKRVLCDLHGRSVEHVELIAPPKPGRRLALTIDRNIQYHAYRALKAAVKKHDARAGAAVLLDARSGEVLALVNQPSFNPNTREFVSERRRNRVLTDVFEPGSTIKPFVVAALLDGGHASVDTEVDTTPGYYKVSGKSIADLNNYGTLTLPDIIVKSSNVGISKAAMVLPAEALWETFRKLGFGEIPGTGFPGEVAGRLPHHVDWRDIDQAVLSYGYSLSVSLLQLAHAYGAFANDGRPPPLSLVKGVQPPPAVQVFKPETARVMRGILERVVSGSRGTGARAKVEGFTTAGKTGTTHKNRRGAYVEEEYLSLFVGFAPASDPRLVAAVVIDTPAREEYFGGAVAAPVFSEIMRYALRRLGVPRDEIPSRMDAHYTLANE